MAEQDPALRPFPFPLPEAFTERLGYRWDRRLVGVYWASDHPAITDGEHTKIGGMGAEAYEELLYQPQVQAWLWEQEIDLGSSSGPEKHWLLVDRQEHLAYICPVAAARDKIRTQRLAE